MITFLSGTMTGRANPVLPDYDFWMFGETTVVRMRYRDHGTQVGRELVDSPDLDTYRGWRDAAWQATVPFGGRHARGCKLREQIGGRRARTCKSVDIPQWPGGKSLAQGGSRSLVRRRPWR